MRSMLPARSRCVAWTASTTPTSGSAISARRAISPVVYIPISSTAASCVASSLSRVIGSPLSELRLPSLRSVRSPPERTSATISLASVLPVEPVMPTTRTAWRARHQAARSPSARSASGTITSGTATSAGSASSRSTSAAAAPALTASATNAWPSTRVAGKRHEERAGGHPPRVDRRAADHDLAGPHQPATDGGGHVRDRDGGSGRWPSVHRHHGSATASSGRSGGMAR